MKLNRVGFVGWRGMVGSVLLQRMRAEDDFALIEQPQFFTTSQVGQPGPDIGRATPPLAEARDLDRLAKMEVIVTCQGGDYTAAVHADLRRRGWRGYWIDAASTLRMNADASIILDPVNASVIERGLAAGNKDFIGGNCTVSLMMMALNGLFDADLIEWMAVTTYQAISGGGARQMRELLAQMGRVHHATAALLDDPSSSILHIDKTATEALRAPGLPSAEIGYPLAGSLLPWVDRDLACGVSREEWKGAAEGNKILGKMFDREVDGGSDHNGLAGGGLERADLGADPLLAGAAIPIESLCIRIGVLRCHSQAFTIKLKEKLPENDLGDLIAGGCDWVKLVANERQASLAQLTPAAVSGTLDIAVGRLRKLALPTASGEIISAFTVGDQLLWGAAEPLRRMLRILHRH